MSLYLVDGTFEIFRCFHAAEAARNASGQEVGAARAFFHTIASLLREDDLTHIAIAFDSVVSRVSPTDDSSSARLRSQFPIAADVARALGITVWPMSRYQADDALATGAALYADHVDRTVICSNDNDFCQCVRGDRIVRLDRIRKEITNEDDVVARFGVRPEQIPDYLALVGDPSDGIPGIPGFGPKAAAALITRYDRIDDIPVGDVTWDVSIRGAAKLVAMLTERRQEALLYRNLSRLRTDVPLPDTLDHLAFRGADRAGVESIVRTLEEPALLERTVRYTEG